MNREDRIIKTFYTKGSSNAREISKYIDLNLKQVRSTISNLERMQMVEKNGFDMNARYQPCLYKLSDRGINYAKRKF